MEPQPPQSSNAPQRPPTPPPPPAPPSGGGRVSGAAAPPPVEQVFCPVCREPRAEDARFCEECGHDYGGMAPPPAGEKSTLSGPLLWVFMLFWIVVIVGGLLFLYSAIWSL